MTIGVVVGTGIFLAPSTVASACPSVPGLFALWLVGGLVSLVGALCYAEMATSFPDRGGDYQYLRVALGDGVAFLFGWARMTIIQAGTIASLAYAFGDYAAQVVPLGRHGPAWLAAAAVIVLSVVHACGLKRGTRLQNLLTAIKLLGLCLLVAAGFSHTAPEALSATPAASGGFAWGLALVFVMYTYGGWNEAAYLAGEMAEVRRSFLRAVAGGMVVIAALYLLVNAAMLNGLGLAGMQASDVVAADLMRAAWGDRGAVFISLLVACSALGAASATIFTGARTNYALGRDHAIFGFMGRWHEPSGSPRSGLLVQVVITLALIGLGAWTREGFTTMVEYTAPGFWLFLFLSGVSLFVLRRKTATAPGVFRVPWYPWLPALFCLASGFMFVSSVQYALTLHGLGARVGIVVLLAGLPVLAVQRWMARRGFRAG